MNISEKNFHSPSRIAIHPSTPDLYEAAKILAKELNLPILGNDSSLYDYLLMLTPEYLGLCKVNAASKPVYVDFLSKKMRFRMKKISLKNELLARALGLKKGTSPKIIDATGGLGRDSYIIASLGFAVALIERSFIIHALLIDGKERAQKQSPALDSLNRLTILHADAITWLTALPENQKPDIIYLDPMFPARKKSALPKQDMLIFHEIVGDDNDCEQLLATALACATRRVVVKRPRLANTIASICPPTYSLTGSSSRFDIYII